MDQVHQQAESSKTAASRALSNFDTQVLEDEIARRMARFSSRQLEQELARRRNKHVRMRQAGVTRFRESRPGNNSHTPIDLTGDDVELRAVMKIDNEDEDELQADVQMEVEHEADVKSEGERDSDVDAAANAVWGQDFESKVENESEAADDLFVADGNDGGNDLTVKIESESEAGDEVDMDLEFNGGNDDGNRFRAKVENESEAESEIDGENDLDNYFLAPVDDDVDTGMVDNGTGGSEVDIGSDVEADMEHNAGGDIEDDIQDYLEDDLYDGMENNMEDEVIDETGDGAVDDAEVEIANETNGDKDSDMQNDIEGDSEDIAKERMEDDVEEYNERYMQNVSDNEIQASIMKKARGRGRGRGRAPKRRKKAPPSAVYKANVQSLAELGTIRVKSSTADIDHSMMEKIKNCLSRGQHPSTPEAEAKRALLHAKVLMKRHNVSRAEVLAHEPLSAQRQYGGQSTVFLRRVDGNTSKAVKQHCFGDYLLKAMRTFFDCKAYNTKYTKHRPGGRPYPYAVEFTFYGIAENTIAAAMGFEMTYNLISEWSRSQKGKNCYCLGAAIQLLKLAEAEKAAEEAQAKKAERDSMAAKVAQEKAEEEARLARLVPVLDTRNKPSSPDSSDGERGTINVDSDDDLSPGDEELDPDEDDDDHHDMRADFIFEDDEMADIADDSREETIMLEQADSLISNTLNGMDAISRATSPESTRSTPAETRTGSSALDADRRSSEQADCETGADQNWASHMQLTVFRANAAKIADEYLEDKGTKLGKSSRPKSNVVKDWKAYHRGQKDGKKIDVHQRRIKEAQLGDDMSG